MADSTTALIKHNLNVNNIDVFKTQLEKILSISIPHVIFENDDCENNISLEKQIGWKLVVYNYPKSIDIWLYGNKDNSREICFGKEYALVENYCLDHLSQWFMVEICITNSEYKEHLLEERKILFELTKRFGANECILLNGSSCDDIVDSLLNGVDLQDAIDIHKKTYQKKYILNKQSLVEMKLKFENIKTDISSYHTTEAEIQNNWSYTILIDDFSDLK